MIAICDIDGTLAKPAPSEGLDPIARARLFMDPEANASCATISAGFDALAGFCPSHRVVFLTSRHEVLRAVTLDWLRKSVAEYGLPLAVESDDLLMRPKGCRLPGYAFKATVIRHLQKGGAKIAVAIEDDARVLRAFELMGIPTIQIEG